MFEGFLFWKQKQNDWFWWMQIELGSNVGLAWAIAWRSFDFFFDFFVAVVGCSSSWVDDAGIRSSFGSSQFSTKHRKSFETKSRINSEANLAAPHRIFPVFLLRHFLVDNNYHWIIPEQRKKNVLNSCSFVLHFTFIRRSYSLGSKSPSKSSIFTGNWSSPATVFNRDIFWRISFFLRFFKRLISSSFCLRSSSLRFFRSSRFCFRRSSFRRTLSAIVRG